MAAHPLSRTDVRLGIAAAVAMIAVIGTSAFVLGGSETGRSFGPGLAVAVVPPVEPEVLPGETMEVGALNDGFDRAALERAEPPFDDTLPPPAWVGDASLGDPAPRMPMPTPVSAARVIEVTVPAGDPLADGSRAFGFDQPRPDYAGERALRWSRMDTGAPQGAALASGNAGADSPQ
ncbi:hypothetical protein [Brevundimonas sp.]|uniref:hypothetical protein n=1 Tax=Brevundimonas sp. TaxID=1871086 RepID=UPI003D134998